LETKYSLLESTQFNTVAAEIEPLLKSALSS
jgi:hypothetical protein